MPIVADQPSLNKVAYAGRTPAVSFVNRPSAGGPEVDSSTDYTRLAPIDLIWHLESRFEQLRAEGRVGRDHIPDMQGGPGIWIDAATWRCVLNYLAKSYLRDGSSQSTLLWSLAADSFRHLDAGVMERDGIASQIIAALDRYISSWRESMLDPSGERVDLAYLSATTLGYTDWGVVPDIWTGWVPTMR